MMVDFGKKLFKVHYAKPADSEIRKKMNASNASGQDSW